MTLSDQWEIVLVVSSAFSDVLNIFDSVYFLGYSILAWMAAILCASILVEIAVRLVQPVRVGSAIRAVQNYGNWSLDRQESRDKREASEVRRKEFVKSNYAAARSRESLNRRIGRSEGYNLRDGKDRKY